MFTATKRAPDYSDYGPCKSPKVSSTVTDSNSATSDFNRMKVCVRVRPLSQRELQSETKTIIDVIDSNMLVFDPVCFDQANDQYSYHGKVYKEIGKRANKNLQFVFDRVFGDTESNISVYQETTKELVSSLLSGYNCSVFAYGSTGSGKTHTMLGSPGDPGIIFFTTMDLYKQLEEEDNKNLELSISYFEIYNEIIHDLLDPTSAQPLSVLEDANKGMTVKNLSIHQPTDAEHLIKMLEFGNKNRKQHPTDANSESSRSHAIFQISIRRKDFAASQEMSIQVSKMSLIDLAGSERASVAYKTYRSQGLHREGGNINKSLLALGNCINALANNGKQKSSYIPFRSSKLTLILRDSLGGNCQTLMIATASPSHSHYEETHNTLLYAERAKGVQLNVRKNNITVSVQPRDYKQVMDKMSVEKTKMLKMIEDLKNEVQTYKTRAENVPIEPIISSKDCAVETLHTVKNTIDHLFSQRIELRSKLLDCEHNLKLIDLRLLFWQFDNEAIKLLNSETDTEELKTPNTLHSVYSQKLHYSNIRSDLVKEVEENESRIKRFERELLDKTNNDIIIRSYFIENNSLVQSKDSAFERTHCSEIIEDLFKKFETNREMTTLSYGFNNRAFNVLQGQGLLSSDMEAKYKNIIQKIEGKKSVVWLDNIESPKMMKMKELVNLSKLPVYSASTMTPADKRNLVAVREFTPIHATNYTKTPFKNIQPIVPPSNLGNTVTKSRSVSFHSPAASSFRPIQVKFEKENFAMPNSYSSRRTPDHSSVQNSNYDHWTRRFGTSSAKKRNYRTFSNSNLNSGNNNFSGPRTTNTYSFNPNFKPRFRN